MNSLILERKKPKGGSDIKQLTIRAVPGFLIFWHFPTKVTKNRFNFNSPRLIVAFQLSGDWVG